MRPGSAAVHPETPFSSATLCTGTANPENLRQIFQVKLLLEAQGKLTAEYDMPPDLIASAEQVPRLITLCAAEPPFLSPSCVSLRTSYPSCRPGKSRY